MTIFVLFVVVWGNASSGAAIDSRVEFTSQAECIAAAGVLRQYSDPSVYRRVTAVCIEVTRK